MARSFPGSNGNYVSSTGTFINDITGTAFTATIWVKPNSPPDGAMLFCKENGGVGQFDWYYQTSRLEARIFDSGGASDTVTGAINIATYTRWVFLCLRKNGTGANALQILIDSVVDGQATSNKTIRSTNPETVIGNRGQNDSPWSGSIAEAAYWNTALSDNEIRSLNGGASPLSIQLANLKGYWPLCGDNSPEPDSAQGQAGSVVGTLPKVDHVPVISPCLNLGVPSHAGWPGRG